MFGTDTFLAGYARVAHPYDFRSLRYILAGAEPVKEATRRTYMEKFGLRILEGYGVTETAPALALNTPMFNKFGSVGRILPGMEARLEKVEGVEEGGRLFVRGPNVMLGYLKVENPGVLEPPPEGWHDTGDIVTIDEQGFLTIKGRAKRFAKIGGEMISLAAVEALAGELWPNEPSAVVAVPDLRKGERLILLTQHKGATRGEFQAFAKSKHASDLMIPSDVWVLDKLPMLGSGKVELDGRGQAGTGAARRQAGRDGARNGVTAGAGIRKPVIVTRSIKSLRSSGDDGPAPAGEIQSRSGQLQYDAGWIRASAIQKCEPRRRHAASSSSLAAAPDEASSAFGPGVIAISVAAACAAVSAASAPPPCTE